MIQIGARNMQNFELLKAVGRLQTPVLLKRGLANTLEELVMSAEYIMAEGNPTLCCASAASAPLSRACATRWTWPPCRC